MIEFNLKQATLPPNWRWKNFTAEELACKCGCNEVKVDEGFLDRLQAVREEVGFSMPVNSGYRCAKHNAEVSHTGDTGPHTQGHAVDIQVSGNRAFTILLSAMRKGFTGFGFMQKGPFTQRYIHLDDLTLTETVPRPTIWSY